jgi:hypothetical protein
LENAKRRVYVAQKVNDDYTHILGIFSTFDLAVAEVNRYMSKYAFEGYPKEFERVADALWRKEKPDDDWGDIRFLICRYDLDLGSTQL